MYFKCILITYSMDVFVTKFKYMLTIFCTTLIVSIHIKAESKVYKTIA